MTLHKLSAGSGYEYLTRQVAALDSTEKGTTPLADYYSAKGESPGHWVGSGLVGVDGLEVGDVVTAEQMKQLFGTGSHPLTGEQLGAAYKVYHNTGLDGFNAEVARRVRASEGSTNEGHRPPYDVLARVRTEVARVRFVAEHGREPATARELSDALRRYSRPRQTAVAGYDLTFSPVKSVSALWAVAPTQVARAIEQAHDAAVADALAFIEREVLFTREGRNGARQVETRGLIAAAFTHRDSRAGDPDLHTHVAVANKVQTASGKWLSIYGKVLHEHVVAASETYNTALERHLVETLGVTFVERPAGARGKRPVREIEGVSAELCERWSQRRTRYGEALHAWQERIVVYVGHRDEQTGQLAKYLDGLQRKGVDAERMLELAVARKPLPVDHPTAALAYRVKELVARRTRNAAQVDDFRRTTPSAGPALGL